MTVNDVHNVLSAQNWDTGRGFEMSFVYRAGYTALTLAILSALGLAFYTPGSS